jgi:Tfp pilus assembly protein PilO
MLLDNLGKRDKIIILIVGLLIFSYMYFTFVLTPVGNKIINEQKVVANKKTQYKDIEIMKLSNPQEQKKLEEAKQKFDKSVKQLPKNERNPDITYNFNDLALKGNVRIKSLAFDKDKDYSIKKKDDITSNLNSTKNNTVDTSTTGTKLMLVPVTIVVSGDYVSTLKFIASIESDNRVTEVQTVNMVATIQGSNVLDTTFLLNYYFGESGNKDEPTYDMKSDSVGKENLFN